MLERLLLDPLRGEELLMELAVDAVALDSGEAPQTDEELAAGLRAKPDVARLLASLAERAGTPVPRAVELALDPDGATETIRG